MLPGNIPLVVDIYMVAEMVVAKMFLGLFDGAFMLV